MVFVSYFGNHRNIKEQGLEISSISRYSPKYLPDVHEIKQLAPSADLLSSYKTNPDTGEYATMYGEQLNKLNLLSIVSETKGKALCCYEKTGDFCHRGLLSAKLIHEGIDAIELKKEYNISIIGSRDFNDREYMFSVLDSYIAHLTNVSASITIVSGGARGADRLGKEFAIARDHAYKEYPADFKKYGKAAGFIRNKDIIDASDIVFAFWDGVSKGTKHSISLANKSGKIIYTYINKKKYAGLNYLNSLSVK